MSGMTNVERAVEEVCEQLSESTGTFSTADYQQTLLDIRAEVEYRLTEVAEAIAEEADA